MIRNRTKKLALRTETLAAIAPASISLDKVAGGAQTNQQNLSPLCMPTHWESCLCAGR